MSLEHHIKISEIENVIEADVKFCEQRAAIEEKLIKIVDATGQEADRLLLTLAKIDILQQRILPLRHRRLQAEIYRLQSEIERQKNK